MTLADGGRVNAAICQATVLWDGASRDIDVDVLETTPLVGMALMKGYEPIWQDGSSLLYRKAGAVGAVHS